MKLTGEPAAVPGPDSERRHIFSSLTSRWYASRLPLRETAGSEASPTLKGSRSGSREPEASTFQRLPPVPKKKEPKMISRPFGVQAEPKFKSFNEVRRLGSPLGFKSSVKSSR